ncbi:MAG: methylenetetrahydrofolate reductase [NAD(P)H] [Peptococcaceae bacterium]|nr:methylenetetrahydrofolate reductase [NAD(P)H] [Peptococcaceae bacterium]MDH7523763.1 methylenetetrahydrofolate reductase [NAD(P)H] [Peptococcaceae bacterium]
MHIKDIFSSKKPVISFEIFPPKTDSPIETIYSTLEGLKGLKPDYISVTYGAGGSTTTRTVEIATLIKKKYGVESLAHLTCITATRQQINEILQQLKEKGIDNILALRGDLPQDPNFVFPTPLHYRYARDLILELKENWDFSVGGACYPEGHPDCDSMEKDLLHLKEKVEAGLDFLITQLFFDNEKFYNFKDLTVKYGIDRIPIDAGIMPVLNKKQIERITSLCRATMPKKFIRIMDRYEHNPEALKEAGIAYATEQIIDLLSWGVDGIHIYTMNRPEVARKIVENISSIREYITG